MRRRRFLAGLAGAAAGCAAPGGSGTGRPGDPVVLTVLSHYGSEPLKSAFQKVLDEWNAGHDRVRVRSTPVRYADLLTTAMVRQAAGQGADILHPYTLWAGQLTRAGVLQPAPPGAAALIRHGFTRAAVTAASVQNTLYGYPTEVQTYALYCNMRLLRAAGVTRPPRTWRELEDAAYASARHDGHGNTLVQGFGLSRTEDATVVGQTLALLASCGGSYLTADGGRAAIDSPAGRAVVALERRLIERGASSPGTDLYRAFPSGRVAMAISAGWWTGSLKNAMGSGYRDVRVVPVPGPATGDRGTLTTGFLLGVNAKSRHPRAAWDFLRWLNSDETRGGDGPHTGDGTPAPRPTGTAPGRDTRLPGVTRMSALQFSVGSMTGRSRDMRTLLGTTGDANLVPFLDALGYATPEPNGPHAQKAKSLLRKNIEEVWTGQRSVDDALRTARRQIDHALSGDP
ncbi:extracellular solute-binding protein [Streptomyces celluloflavus]|uniref:extracellular solute-binding protein n=1 Tax=Streptomyces celluloflavus TaxID=58344 RepID=UPI00378C441A